MAVFILPSLPKMGTQTFFLLFLMISLFINNFYVIALLINSFVNLSSDNLFSKF